MEKEKGVISRRNFLFLLFMPLLGFMNGKGKNRGIIRPPAALKEEKFLTRCIRCGNCMKVCITNGLQPVLMEGGLSSMWTPKLVPEVGYCEYNCTLCGDVCPTGAIPHLSLDQKQKTKLGLAFIDTGLCLPWSKNTECIVCEEHCPVSQKAIKLEKVTVNGKALSRPYIDWQLCVGCGICQNKCPVRPKRAITVSGAEAVRTT